MVKLLPKIPTSGSIHVEFKRCGKPTCRCMNGHLHGPYFYHHFREGYTQRKLYIAPESLIDKLSELEGQKALEINLSEMNRVVKELDECLMKL